MITDAQLRPSNVQSLAGAAATTVSTNSIDLLSAGRNLGRGQPMRAHSSVAVAFTGGTSVQAQLISSATGDLANPTVLASGPVLTDAQATVGAKLMDIALPDNVQRYYGFQYVTVGTHTTGATFAHILSDTDYNPYIASITGY